MPEKKIEKLDQIIRELKALAEQAYELSQDIPAAEKNLYMVLQQIAMLEIEISDPVSVLREGHMSQEE